MDNLYQIISQIKPRAMYNHGSQLNLFLYTHVVWSIMRLPTLTIDTSLRRALKIIPDESAAYTLEKRVRIDLHEFTKK